MPWILRGNIQGPAGGGAGEIPDPLVVDNEMDLGADARMVQKTGGMKIQVRGPGDVWTTQVEYP